MAGGNVPAGLRRVIKGFIGRTVQEGHDFIEESDTAEMAEGTKYSPAAVEAAFFALAGKDWLGTVSPGEGPANQYAAHPLDPPPAGWVVALDVDEMRKRGMLTGGG